jgi:hypothetical protein
MFTLSFVNENICPCGFSGLDPNPGGDAGGRHPGGPTSSRLLQLNHQSRQGGNATKKSPHISQPSSAFGLH